MISLALLAAVSLDAAAIAQTSAALNALGPHPFGSPRNQAAAQFVAAKFLEAGLAQTSMDGFMAGDTEGTNVVARLPGRSDRLLIIATHHDSTIDALDVSDRSRSLSILVEIGRQASRLQPAKTWILASFDGGESKGEGFAHYLNGLGKSRDLVDGVLLIDASSLRDPAGGPSIVVPACAFSDSAPGRGIASHDLVAAALGGIPESVDVSFDDPGISLLTQPFIRAFKTVCDQGAARALADHLGVIVGADTSYSERFLSAKAVARPEPPPRDEGAARLAAVVFGALQGMDASTPSSPQSDSWLVVGRSVWPGWLIFLFGLLTLLPGLFALRSHSLRLGVRALYSGLFTAVLFFEPEIALFALGFPNLVPPSASRKALTVSLAPFALLALAGLLGFLRGQVTGSWLSIWLSFGLLACVVLLFAAPRQARKAPSRTKRGKR
ncbi:MAG: hypothetical protein JJE39_11535 [Vicinamibacteria bacterium]|nr:hypothetical protein [Vicinamibacteria bacterium]